MLASGRCWSWFVATRLRAVVAVVGLVGLVGCPDGTNGPDGSGTGYIALQPAVSADIQNGRFSLGVDAIGLRLERPGSPGLAVDTVFEFHPDSTVVHAGVRVGMLRRVEEFYARLTLQAGDLVLFSGSKLILLQQGPPGTNDPDSVSVAYQGPGRDIASITIQPSDTVLPFGQSLPLRVLALDSGGSPVSQFFVSWSASDTTPGRLDAFGVLQAPEQRGAVTVSARTPNGASASGHVHFIPGPPYDLLLVGSDTVSAPVGSAVSLAVRVIAADSLGVEGIPVRFSASTPTGSVTDSMVVSDSSGLALTQVVVGEALRDYTYEARLGAQSPSRFTVAALAGPPALMGIEGGNAQVAPAGTELEQPIAVRVRDAHGNPVRGQRISFVVTSGGGSVWAGSNNTNDSGVAMERWTLGRSTAVAQGLEARAVDNTTGERLLYAIFEATALAGPPATVTVSPSEASLGAIGATVNLGASVADQFGNLVPGAAVTWTSSDGDVATVSAAGVVTAVGNGAATITATSGTASDGAAVTVAQQATGVEVSPQITTLSALGETAQLTATARDEGGTVIAGAPIDWASSDAAVATVSAAGVVTAVGNGTVTIRGTSGAVSDAATVTVAQQAEAVEVTAGTLTLDAVGAIAPLTAIVRDAGGSVIEGAEIVWASSDAGVATVNDGGVVTAVGNGSVRITATVAGSVVGFADLTVAQAIATVEVTPEQTTLNDVGASVQLEISVLDPNGHPVDGASVTWASSDPGVATVNSNGRVTAVGPGDVTVTATVSGNVAQTVTLAVAVAVTPTVAHVLVTPTPVSLSALGASVALSARAVDGAGNDVPGVTVSWASSNDAVASVSAAGVVAAVGNGTATITATSGTVSGAADVTVAQAVSTVEITPPAVSLSAVGQQVTLDAVARDARSNAVTGAVVTWSSDNDAVAAVDGSGLVTATGNGTAIITAASAGVLGTATVRVGQVAAVVQMSPEITTLTALGATVMLTATVRDAGGTVIDGAAVGWASSDAGVATVSAAGMVTAVANGTATITATSGAASGTAAVTVAIPSSPLTVVIRAGQGSNKTINLGSSGSTPVAILTTSTSEGDPVTFDASTVDVGTVRFGGAAPANLSPADVDHDGDVDLQLHFTTADLNFTPGSTTVTLTGSTTDGVAFEGHEDVVIIAESPPPAPPPPPEPAPLVVGSVEVAPASTALGAIGATVQLAATVRASDFSVMNDALVSWSSSDPSVAGVDASGLVTAVSNGSAMITASSDGVSGTALVAVAQAPAAVVVNPASLSFGALGATAQLSATVRDANDYLIADAELTWTSSDAGVANVNQSGLVSAMGNGSVTVTATSGGAAGQATVSVAQVVSVVTVTPASLALVGVGSTGDLNAAALDANGNVVATSFAWFSTDENVVQVDGAGTVTAAGPGTATIVASVGGVSGSATVSVDVPAPPPPEPPLAVAIEVKPGVTEETKPINLTSDGVTPVALLTTAAAAGEPATFDAAAVVTSSVTFAGAPALHSSLKDVDGDGDLDRVFQFDTQKLQITVTSTSATLQGRTAGDRVVQGSAAIRVIK